MEPNGHKALQDILSDSADKYVAGQQFVGSVNGGNPDRSMNNGYWLQPTPALDTLFLPFMQTTQIDNDFYGWLADQVKVLHSRQHKLLDWDNLAEELEAMGVSQRRELKSRLRTLLLHLLKWQTQPNERDQRARSWMLTIREQRREITDLITLSPSLEHYLPDLVSEAWEWACEDALDDAPNENLPPTCPWAYALFMARDFLPPDLPLIP